MDKLGSGFLLDDIGGLVHLAQQSVGELRGAYLLYLLLARIEQFGHFIFDLSINPLLPGTLPDKPNKALFSKSFLSYDDSLGF